MPEYDYSVFNPLPASAPDAHERHADVNDASDDKAAEYPHTAHGQADEEAKGVGDVDEELEPVGNEEPDYITQIKNASASWDGSDIEHPIVEVNLGDDGLYHLRYKYSASLDASRVDPEKLKKLVTRLKAFLKEYPDVVFEFGGHRFYEAGESSTWAGLTEDNFRKYLSETSSRVQ
jgi:hypothetical protein